MTILGKPTVWVVKWVATVMVLIAVSFRSAGSQYYMFDLVFGCAGTALWLWVAIVWKDRALILLNATMMVMLLCGTTKSILG